MRIVAHARLALEKMPIAIQRPIRDLVNVFRLWRRPNFPLVNRSFKIPTKAQFGGDPQSYLIGQQGRPKTFLGSLFVDLRSVPPVELLPLADGAELEISGSAIVPIQLRKDAKAPSVNLKSEFSTEKFEFRTCAGTILHLKVDAPVSQLQLDSKDLSFGVPIRFSGSRKSHGRAVEDTVLLFVDGFAMGFLSPSMEENAPNLYSIFGGSECFTMLSSGEWTLPSFGSLWSGLSTLEHGLWHPTNSCSFPKSASLIPEVFREHGFVTSWVHGNLRTTPDYGYMRGIDRLLYWRRAPATWVVEQTLDFASALPDRSHLLIATFMDLHMGWPDLLPPFSVQARGEPAFIAGNRGELGVSVHQAKSEQLIDTYRHQLHRLDSALGPLLNWANDRDANIVLFTDHGQSYFSDSNWILDDQRTLVPLFVLPSRRRAEVAGGVDWPTIGNYRHFFNIISNMAKPLDAERSSPGSLRPSPDRNLLLSESIYPGQTYKVRARSGNEVLDAESLRLVSDSGIRDVGPMRVVGSSSSSTTALFEALSEHLIRRSGLHLTT